MRTVGIVTLVILVVLQVTLLKRLAPFEVAPDAVLTATASIAVIAGWRPIVFVTAVALGIVLDALGGTPLGLTSLGFVLVVLAVGWWREVVVYRGIAVFLLAAGVATVVFDGVLLLALLALHDPASVTGTMKHIVLPSVLINAVCAAPLSKVAEWVCLPDGQESIP
ncbi:MAG: hypothetical protein M1296_02570 [Chloroflexi bacterium]|nr:hypothetical protein [Chloroflexota bacterium]